MVFWSWIWVGLPRDKFTDQHFRHELQHCYQIERLGRLKFYALYVVLWFKHGYNEHPFEIEAEIYEREPLSPKEKQWKKMGRVIL